MARLSFPPTISSKTPYTHNGKTLTLRQWATEVGLPYNTLRQRYVRGVRGDALFSKDHLSVGHHRGVKHVTQYKGESVTIRELSRITGLRYDTLCQRHLAGLTGDALTNPDRQRKTTVLTDLITHNNKSLTLVQWADELQIKLGTLRARYVKGLRGAELLAPVQPRYIKNSDDILDL